MWTSRMTDCLINEYTIWSCGPVQFRASPCVICGGESRMGPGFFFDYFSLHGRYHFTIFHTQISLIFHRFSMILALTVSLSDATSVCVFVCLHIFSVLRPACYIKLPKKLRLYCAVFFTRTEV